MRCCSAHLASCGTYASGCSASLRAFTAPPGIARGQSPRVHAPDTTGGVLLHAALPASLRVPLFGLGEGTATEGGGGCSTSAIRRYQLGGVLLHVSLPTPVHVPLLGLDEGTATEGGGVCATSAHPLHAASLHGERGARPARFRVPLFGPRRRGGDGRRWVLFHTCASATYHTHRGRWRLVRLNTPQKGRGVCSTQCSGSKCDGSDGGAFRRLATVAVDAQLSPLCLKRSARSQSHSGRVIQGLIQLPNFFHIQLTHPRVRA